MPSDNRYLTVLEKEKPTIEPLIAPYFDRELWLNNAKALWKAIQRSNDLSLCSAESLVGCVEEAARRGLEIGSPNKHCAVVPFKLKSGGMTAILITQWQGKAFMWMKTGAIRKLKADVVYTGDRFELISGDEDRIVHVPDFAATRSPQWLNSLANIVAAYAVAWLWSGERVHAVVTQSQIKRTMDWIVKKNGDLGFGWKDWLPEMCMKTAVHRLDGKIQPPPHMDPEQIAAWQRASAATGIEAEFEQVNDEPLPPDILPKGDPAPEPGKSEGAVRVVHNGAPVSDEDMNKILDARKKAGVRISELPQWINANVDLGVAIDDLSELKASHVAPVLDALKVYANG